MFLTLLLMASFTASLLGVVAHPTPARAEPHWCGVACDGKAPSSYVVMSDGRRVRCSDSQRVVSGPYYPDDPNYFDPAEDNTTDVDIYMRGYHMYSTTCETTWLQVTNLRATGRTSCTMQEWRNPANRRAHVNGVCPAAGRTTVTPMLDDHDPQHASINYGFFSETGGGWPYRQFRTNLY